MNTVALLFAAASLAFALVLSEPVQDERPAVLHSVAPAYPPAARAARVMGEVVVEVTLDDGGAVSAAEAVSGPPLLRAASADAARLWRFEPGARGATVSLTFEYLWAAGEEVRTGSPYRAAVIRPKTDTVSRVPEDAEGKTCEVHGFALERDKVDIVYGYMLTPVGFAEAARKQFPNANSWVSGGCIIWDESPKYAEVIYCRACRASEEKWEQEHRPQSHGG